MFKNNKKTVLITGGAGFLGHQVVEHFYKNTDWNIVILDCLNYAGNLNKIADTFSDIEVKDPERVKIVWHDLRAPISETTHKMLGRLDFCAHLAAESIPENIYIPIQSVPRVGTRMLTFGETWEEQARKSKPQKTPKGEVIFLKGKQTKVLSFLNGGQWMPVKAITRHWYEGNIIKLQQKWGVIEATPNHSIYASNLELTNPQKNPELLVVRKINERHKKYKKVSFSLLEILAAYITEGNATFNKANGGFIVEISQSNKKWLENIGRLIKEEFKINYCIVRHKNKKGKDWFGLQVSNKNFFQYLVRNCGQYSDRKYFPNWIFDLVAKQREFFWQKLLEGDGTKDGRYSTTSYKLINQIGLLLALQGADCRFFEYDRKGFKRSWEVKTHLSGQHYGLNKKIRKEIDYKGWVYDIEVENSHNFACGIGNVVCHNTHVDRSLQDSVPFVMSNVLGTAHLLEYFKKFQPQCRALIFSTDEVFGEAPPGVAFKEEDRLAPSNAYSASKAGEEMIAYAFAHSFSMPISFVRSVNIFGERQHPEKFVPKTISAILNDEKVIIHGKNKDDLTSRCWIHARNVADALLFLTDRAVTKEAYHIVAEEKTVLDIAHLICEEIKGRQLKDGEVAFVPANDVRPGFDKRYFLSGTKLAKMGWSPPLGLEQALKKTVRWTIENPKWLHI